MGQTDNFLISLMAPEKAVPKVGWLEKFGMGSTPSTDASDYPSMDELLGKFEEMRSATLAHLETLSGDLDPHESHRIPPNGTGHPVKSTQPVLPAQPKLTGRHRTT